VKLYIKAGLTKSFAELLAPINPTIGTRKEVLNEKLHKLDVMFVVNFFILYGIIPNDVLEFVVQNG
jgi:hypothetical protein